MGKGAASGGGVREVVVRRGGDVGGWRGGDRGVGRRGGSFPRSRSGSGRGRETWGRSGGVRLWARVSGVWVDKRVRGVGSRLGQVGWPGGLVACWAKAQGAFLLFSFSVCFCFVYLFNHSFLLFLFLIILILIKYQNGTKIYVTNYVTTTKVSSQNNIV